MSSIAVRNALSSSLWTMSRSGFFVYVIVNASTRSVDQPAPVFIVQLLFFSTALASYAGRLRGQAHLPSPALFWFSSAPFSRLNSWITAFAKTSVPFQLEVEGTNSKCLGVHATFYHPHTGRQCFFVQLCIQQLRHFMQDYSQSRATVFKQYQDSVDKTHCQGSVAPN